MREIEGAIEATFTKIGYPAVNSEQFEAVKEFVKGKDVFVSTPTGSGKSLGCLPLVFDSLRSGERIPDLRMLFSYEVACDSSREHYFVHRNILPRIFC